MVGEAPPGAGQNVDIPTAELPAGGAFPVTGSGTWHVIPGTTPQAGTGRVYTYTVEVEDGAVLPEGDQAFATAVDATLTDPRSWVGSGQIAVRRIDTGDPDFRVSLSAQMTARGQCGYAIRYEASCWKSDIGRVLINGARWVRGAGAFDGQLGLYRQYAINHEVGHVFNNPHVPCPVERRPRAGDDAAELRHGERLPRAAHRGEPAGHADPARREDVSAQRVAVPAGRRRPGRLTVGPTAGQEQSRGPRRLCVVRT